MSPRLVVVCHTKMSYFSNRIDIDCTIFLLLSFVVHWIYVDFLLDYLLVLK